MYFHLLGSATGNMEWNYEQKMLPLEIQSENFQWTCTRNIFKRCPIVAFECTVCHMCSLWSFCFTWKTIQESVEEE